MISVLICAILDVQLLPGKHHGKDEALYPAATARFRLTSLFFCGGRKVSTEGTWRTFCDFVRPSLALHVGTKHLTAHSSLPAPFGLIKWKKLWLTAGKRGKKTRSLRAPWVGKVCEAMAGGHKLTKCCIKLTTLGNIPLWHLLFIKLRDRF